MFDRKLWEKAFIAVLCNILILDALLLPIAFAEDLTGQTPPTEKNYSGSDLSESQYAVDGAYTKPSEYNSENQGVIDDAYSKEMPLTYPMVMRGLRDIRETGSVDKDGQISKEEILGFYDEFVKSETEKLNNLPVDEEKEQSYFTFLKNQRASIENVATIAIDKVLEYMTTDDEIKILEKPAAFKSNEEPVEVEAVEDLQTSDQNIPKEIEGLFEKAEAAGDEILPTIEDVKEDGGEVKISLTISDLAKSLHNNPVEIVNYVKNNIDFEPYFGAKKGSVGCLSEKICNDTDTASLTIALMRAAGIPARYKKGLAIISVPQLKKLLGVEDVKTVYYALKGNGFPIFSLNAPVPQDLDEADLSRETHFALDWTLVEIFYDYDDRGADIDNTMNFNDVETTADVREKFVEKFNKQWLPVEPTIKSYTHTQNEIVADTANFDTEDFWYDFLRYQGDLSPVEKYAADLLTATGKDVNEEDYQSTKTITPENLEILPYKTPYILAQGEATDGTDIDIENWSILPAARRSFVTVSLLRHGDNSEIFSHNFDGSEINNAEIDLAYQGATPADQQIIESYGGIHATPALLVDILPYLSTGSGEYVGEESVEIGDLLVFQFEYGVGDTTRWTDQKFSIAGNQEGIYVVLSKVQDVPYLDNASKILLEGNAASAREYLSHNEKKGDLLKKSLDYEYNIQFSRAVITQSRVLSEVDGVPSTFDFSGLVIDAGAYINDYSNRGNYKTHRKDFHLIWPEENSYYEDHVLKDLTGMDAISTVTGLQYAYAHPETYTVHVINSRNESVIDTLALTPNTKANMHADIAEGNTIITPDKFVEEGAFRGVLYVSLDDDWTGVYAIGEQVGNGGLMVAMFRRRVASSSFFIDPVEYFEGLAEDLIDALLFYYQDTTYKEGRVLEGLKCSLTEEEDNRIKTTTGWIEDYGFPCYGETVEYGSTSHTYILASLATKFYSPGKYNYWADLISIWDVLTENIDNPDTTKWKFNPIARTYSYNTDYAVYYKPAIGAGTAEGIYVTGDILDKLMEPHYDSDTHKCDADRYTEDYIERYCKAEKWVLYKIGFPLTPVTGTSSNFGGVGFRQTFIGGEIYNIPTLTTGAWITSALGNISSVNYVPGLISERHQEKHDDVDNFAAIGFPLMDPLYDENNLLVQNFENGRIHETANGAEIESGQSLYEIMEVQVIDWDAQFWEGFWDQMAEEGIFGILVDLTAGYGLAKAITALTKFLLTAPGLSERAISGVIKFVKGAGLVILGVILIEVGLEIKNLNDECMDFDSEDYKYFCGKRDAVGLLVVFGALSESMGLGRQAEKLLNVTSPTARRAKLKVFSLIKGETEMDNLIKHVKNNVDIRTKYFTNLDKVTDTVLLGKIVNDNDITARMTKYVNLYEKSKIDNFYDAGYVNNTFLPNDYPSFKPGTGALELTLTNKSSTDFVRVYNSAINNQNGKWIMPKEEIVGLTPEGIKDKFSLTYIPDKIVDVELPNGSTLIEGIANYNPLWGAGGGIQYLIRSNLTEIKFFNSRNL